jgi:hypothetical protein
MSGSNDKNLMTTVQIKRQLKSIHTDKSDIKDSLLNLLEQSQCLDSIAKSVGLVKEGFSFVSRVSWKTILSNLEQSDKNENGSEEIKLNEIIEIVSQSSNQLENELIPQLQKYRNYWMLEVILIECVFLGLLGLAVAGVTHIQGVWSLSSTTISVQPFLYERPVFSLITSVMLFFSFVVMHFSIRNFIAEKFVRKLKNESSEFDLAGAFLKNTRIQHSIFRPDIIGRGWLSRKCIFDKGDNV